MITTIYKVQFRLYQYNGGDGYRSGSKLKAKNFNIYSEAKTFRDNLFNIKKWYDSTVYHYTPQSPYEGKDYTEEHHELINHYLDYDGYLEHVEQHITKIITQSIILPLDYQEKTEDNGVWEDDDILLEAITDLNRNSVIPYTFFSFI